MKKFTYLFLAIICSFLYNQSFSQWQQPDIRLTNAAGFSTNPSLTASGNYLHAVWQDTRATGSEIFYKRSTNQGLTWEADVQLTDQPNSRALPGISADGSNVYLVWEDSRDGISNFEIYFKKSSDNGATWGADIRLTNNSNISTNAAVNSDGQNLHVIWRDTRDGSHEMFYKRSTDGGNTWSNDTMLTDHTSGLAASISITAEGSNIHLAWSDTRDNDDYEIYYKRSTNGGISWGTDIRLTNELNISESPAITCNSTEVHLTWIDLRDSNINAEIYYKRSTDNGSTWSADTRLTVYANAQNPDILLSGSIVHLVWHSPTITEIHYQRSINNGSSWGMTEKISSSFTGTYQPCIAVTGNKAHIIWHDVRNGSTNSEIYYDYNTSANAIGITNISTEVPEIFGLSQNYPNPFNPVTNIKFSIPKTGNVKLAVFDVTGKQVTELINTQLSAGAYKYDFNATLLSSGVYFYKLVTADFSEVKKMVLVK